MLFGKETLSVRDAYKHYGFECAKKNREPDDQLGIELEFIARLFDMALEALQSGNEARAQELLLSKQQFIEEHLARWIPRWNELVQQHACTSFYRGIAFLVLGAIEEDLSPCCA